MPGGTLFRSSSLDPRRPKGSGGKRARRASPSATRETLSLEHDRQGELLSASRAGAGRAPQRFSTLSAFEVRAPRVSSEALPGAPACLAVELVFDVGVGLRDRRGERYPDPERFDEYPPESCGYFDLKAERRLQSLDTRRNVPLRGLSLTRRHRPMGDAGSVAIHFSFHPQLRVEFWGATVTSTSVWVRSSRATSPNVVADAVANSGGGSLPPVYLQPFGGLRRHQRRGAAGRRPSVSDARVPRASGDVRRGHPGFGSRQMSAPRSETINGSLA